VDIYCEIDLLMLNMKKLGWEIILALLFYPPENSVTPRGWGVDIPKGVGLSTDRVLVGLNCRKGRATMIREVF
jgi:hypothetical protein